MCVKLIGSEIDTPCMNYIEEKTPEGTTCRFNCFYFK